MNTQDRMPYLSLGSSLRKRIIVNSIGIFFILLAAIIISLDLFTQTEAKASVPDSAKPTQVSVQQEP